MNELYRLIEASFAHLLGRPLCPLEAPELPDERAAWAYHDAPFALLAHDAAPDPRFVYANRWAQRRFGYTWEQFVGMPSRLSAPPADQGDRNELLEGVEARGYAEGFTGTRVARTGELFTIRDGVMWNLLDEAGARVGQAALFR